MPPQKPPINGKLYTETISNSPISFIVVALLQSNPILGKVNKTVAIAIKPKTFVETFISANRAPKLFQSKAFQSFDGHTAYPNLVHVFQKMKIMDLF